jgi:alanyl-tRNA synthetase
MALVCVYNPFPMTQRLYRTDAYLQQFDARIVARLDHAGRLALILDRTAFYPTSGGQPHDLGTLEGVRVVDVIEREDGQIVHVLDGLAQLDARVDGSVLGILDWPRRLEHMQQHSGQHVLSQAFIRVAGLDTIAVHIGVEENTLDLPVARLASGLAEQAEREANTIVAEDRPIVIYEIGDADLARVPLRKPPKVSGAIRIVEVEDYDHSACGGTHVRTTAQIGPIKITRVERRGNESRVTFRCGIRAMRDYARLNDAIARLMETFSAPRYEVEQAVLKLAAEARTEHKALQNAQARLLAYESAELLAATPAVDGNVRIVARAFHDRSAYELRMLAKLLTAQPRVIALLGTAGESAHLVFARSKDAPGDMSAALRLALGELSPEGLTRGGGSPDFAQGGGVPANFAQLARALDLVMR